MGAAAGGGIFLLALAVGKARGWLVLPMPWFSVWCIGPNMMKESELPHIPIPAITNKLQENEPLENITMVFGKEREGGAFRVTLCHDAVR